jgi:HSP20 family protein
MYTKDLFDLFDNAFFGLNGDVRFETVNGKTFELALPGFSKKDLSIEVDGRILSVSAEIKEDEETRWRHSFHKSYQLPNDADTDQIDAKMENGILSLTFGEVKEARKVTIK